MQRFAKKLPKEDLKKFGREINKILVASDYKHKRVTDPTKMSSSQAEKAKHMVKQFLDKAVEKKKVIDRQRKEKEARKAALNGSARKLDTNGKAVEPEPPIETKYDTDGEPDVDDDLIELTPNSPTPETPAPETPSVTESFDLKRPRDENDEGTPGDESDSKRIKTGEPSPPPPPPPPPAGAMPEDELEGDIDAEVEGEEIQGLGDVVVRETREEKERREQEEELMRENEEAMMMDLDGSLQSAEEVKHIHQNGHINGHSNGNSFGNFETQSPRLDAVTTIERKPRVE